MKHIKRILIFIIFFIIFMNLVGVKIAKADNIIIGVSPSLKKFQLKQGESTSFNISLTNKSIFPKKDMSIKYNLYTFKINSNVKSEDAKKENSDKWITVLDKVIILKPGESKTVPVSITIPQNANIGDHKIVLLFQKDSIKGLEDKNNIQAIQELQVPLYITVTDENGNSHANPSYIMGDKNISSNLFSLNGNFGNGFKTIFKDMFKFIGSCYTFNSDKISYNYNTLLYKPYKLKIKNKTIYDIKNTDKTTLDKVYTSSNVTDTKYIKIPKNVDLSLKIKSLQFDKTKLIANLSDNSNVTMDFKDSNSLQDVQNQINVLFQNVNATPSLEWLMSKVKVNNNVRFDNSKIYFSVNIKNTGNVILFPTGSLAVINDNNKIIANSTLDESVILVNKSNNVISTINLDNKFKEGKYTIISNVSVIKDKPERFTYSFEIQNFRIYFIIGAFVILGISVILILLVLYKIIKFFKKKKERV